jgi:hypothetical protein
LRGHLPGYRRSAKGATPELAATKNLAFPASFPIKSLKFKAEVVTSEQHGGTNNFRFLSETGAHLISEEDFFASSPTANLAGSSKKDMNHLPGGCEISASQPLFV